MDFASVIFFSGYGLVSNAKMLLCNFILFISVLINQLFPGKKD